MCSNVTMLNHDDSEILARLEPVMCSSHNLHSARWEPGTGNFPPLAVAHVIDSNVLNPAS
eukprot:m.282741 g.282741  ORF g.282741 m.282741 type:complete len:60 (-) comp26993_c1_seq2:207-386(-)